MLCLVHVLELEAKQRVWHPAILGGVAARKQHLIGVRAHLLTHTPMGLVIISGMRSRLPMQLFALASQSHAQ